MEEGKAKSSPVEGREAERSSGDGGEERRRGGGRRGMSCTKTRGPGKAENGYALGEGGCDVKKPVSLDDAAQALEISPALSPTTVCYLLVGR